MALVRISRELHHDVATGIRHFADKVYEQTIKPLNPQMAESTFKGGDMFDFCVRKVWGDYFDLYARLKDTKFAKAVERFDLKVMDPNTGTWFDVHVAPENGKCHVPSFSGSYYYAEVRATADEVTALPWAAKFFADRTAFNEAKKAHESKFETIKQQVCAFLNNSKSLNDAIKKWPDIKLWIPQMYLDRVEEKVERVSRQQKEKREVEEATAVIDTTLLASMGVLKAIHSST